MPDADVPTPRCEQNSGSAVDMIRKLRRAVQAHDRQALAPWIIAAGDLNVLRGYGERGSAYWAARYATVFDRMRAIGLPCVGPNGPNGGHAPIVSPDERPADSATVPTFRTNRTHPRTGTRQLDFVFATEDLHPRLTVRALNGEAEWGPNRPQTSRRAS